LDDLAAPDDNTDLDASTAKHGLMMKFPGGTTNFLRADGAFAAPPGGGGGSLTRGTATLNFGAATTLSHDTQVDVVDVGALAAKPAIAFIAGSITSDHSEDEHILEDIRVKVSIPVDGVGFTIYGISETPVYGQYTVQWAY
jgi:hypothetical protein